MKLPGITFLILFNLVAITFAQEANRQPTIQVSGTAEISVAPDEAVLSLEVTKRNKDLSIAKRETDAALAKIIDLTRRFAIKSENVKTDYISVEMKYQSVRDPKNRIFDESGDEIGTRTFLGYEVSTTTTVRLSDLTKFEGFFSEALQTGVSEIGSVKFESSKMIEFREKAREMAMKAAYNKAVAMAGAIHQTIGKAIFIAEGGASNAPFSIAGLANNSANYVSGNTTVSEPVATFSPGSIKISAQVSIVFILN